MPSNNKDKFVLKTIAGLFCNVILFLSVSIIILSMILKKDKDISQDRLRKAYDGLSPQDYQ